MADPIRIIPDRPLQPPAARPNSGAASKANGPSFASVLSDARQVQFSNHAQKRLETRNIALSSDELTRLNQAVDKAEKRGSRDSLVLMDDMAFIVNVRERLVVTALDTQKRGEGVFTNIDSVVLAEQPDPTNSTGNNG